MAGCGTYEMILACPEWVHDADGSVYYGLPEILTEEWPRMERVAAATNSRMAW